MDPLRNVRRHLTSGQKSALRRLAYFRADVSFAMVDAFLVVTVYVAALGVRLLDDATANVRGLFSFGLIRTLPLIVVVHLGANVLFGAYGHLWEYASVAEAKRVAAGNIAAVVTLLTGVEIYRMATDSPGPIPRGTILLAGLLTIVAMGMVRYRSRLFSFRRTSTSEAEQPSSGDRMVVAGVSRLAADLIRRLETDPTVEIVGLVEMHDSGRRRIVAGRSVLGTVDELPKLIDIHDVRQILVVGGDEAVARRVLDVCIYSDVRLRIAPDIDTIIHDARAPIDIRDLEITDLLSRPAVSMPVADVHQMIRGVRVLVTGAGGSIGSEIVRQVQSFSPEAVIALDHDETHLHEAGLRWSDQSPVPVPVLCDVRNSRRLARVIGEAKPDIVFHAAALKHVPILETSPSEAVFTNVLGTQNLITACEGAGVERFVLISTDKAVEASSVMGASKRVAELLIESANRMGTCTYSAVRFGNVLGSRGSVVPTFIHQIKTGGPVTITDPNMTRYFMTVDEAVQLVLQAASLARGGEIFVLDMSDPVRIADLAHHLIRLSGLVPGRDIEIATTGRRPGEKLTEKLSLEPLGATHHPQIGMVTRSTDLDQIEIAQILAALSDLADAASEGAVRSLLLEVANGAWPRDEVDLHYQPSQPTPQPSHLAAVRAV